MNFFLENTEKQAHQKKEAFYWRRHSKKYTG